MLATVLSWVNIPSATNDLDVATSHLHLLDLPFDVLEEIMTYALVRSSPPSGSSTSVTTSNRTGCLCTCKLLNSAGEKELYRSIRVSSQASWVALFGHRTGLLAIDDTRDVARFVQHVTIGREASWDWGGPRSRDESGEWTVFGQT